MSTDFREYSAAFHDHQNELMHYGVKGMKWHKRKAGLKTLPGPQAPKDYAVANRPENEAERKLMSDAARNYKYLQKATNEQLQRIVDNDDISRQQHKTVDLPNGKNGNTRIATGNTYSVALNILRNREKGTEKSPSEPLYKKKTGLQKAATEVARKEEKKRNRKLVNARKAERAYRRGGH